MTALPGKPFKQGHVEAGGFTLVYAAAGPADAPATIVSLPGSAGLEMSTAKDKLAEKYRVIEINPPGWAGREDLTRPMSQQELGALLGEAANTLVAGRYFLLGTSMGGANALYLAEAYPDRVLGIIFEGSMAPARGDVDVKVPPMTDEQRESMVEAVSAGRNPYPSRAPHPRKPWATDAYVADQMLKRGKMMRWVAPDFDATSAIAVVRARRIPVLSLLGTDDEILRPSQEDTFKAVLPEAEFRLIEGGSHDLQNTAPEAFVEAVEAMLRA